MNYIVYAKRPSTDKRFGPMNLENRIYDVGLLSATLISDFERAKGWLEELAALLPDMSFQVRIAGTNKVVAALDGHQLRTDNARRQREAVNELGRKVHQGHDDMPA